MTLPTPQGFFAGGGQALKWPSDVVNGQYFDTSLRGVWRGGRIVADPQVRQVTDFVTKKPVFWADGTPKTQMVVDLQCVGATPGTLDERNFQDPNDNGTRTLYIKGYMISAVRDELRKLNLPGIQVGGELYLCWTGEKPLKEGQNSGKPPRTWAAKYIPPTVGLPGAPSQAPAPQQPAPDPWGQAPTPQQPAPQAPRPQDPAPNPWGQAPAGSAPAPQQPATPAPNPFGQPQPPAPAAPPDPWGQAPATQSQAAPPATPANPWG